MSTLWGRNYGVKQGWVSKLINITNIYGGGAAVG